MESSLSPNIKNFEQNYQTHLKRLKLNGMQPKTIDAYSTPFGHPFHGYPAT